MAILAFLIAFSVGWAIGLFLMFHTVILSLNLTTVETAMLGLSFFRRARLLGSEQVFKNLQEVFGNDISWWSWLMPSLRPLPHHDTMSASALKTIHSA